MRLSVCNELFEGWGLEKVLMFVSGLGYNGIEIAPFTLADDVRSMDSGERRRLRELFQSYQLEVVGLHWLLVSPPGLHILGPDAATRSATMKYMEALIDFNDDIGGRVLVFGSPRQRSVPPGMDPSRAFSIAVQFFKEASRYAEDRGLVIAFEPLARRLTNFVNTVEEAIKLVEAVDSPSFRLVLDVYSMSDEGRPYGEIIRRAGSLLVHFHANDTNGLGPGFGDADYRQIISALRDVGYDGYLSVEVFDTSPGPEYIARRSIENLTNFLVGRDEEGKA